MNPIIYHMSCGCKLQEQGIRAYKGTKLPIKKYTKVCKVHPLGVIAKKTRACGDCGKIDTGYTPEDRLLFFCKKCGGQRKKDNIKKSKARVFTKTAIEMAPPDLDLSKSDCIDWDVKCLNTVIIKDLDCRPCKNCKDYMPSAACIDPYAASGHRDGIGWSSLNLSIYKTSRPA